MAELDSLVTPAQGWRVTGPSSRVLGNMIARQGRAQLLAEAASLTPDFQKLSESLSKLKLSGADMQQYQNQLNSYWTDYTNKYRENPFSAFTRESKEEVRAMQRLVTDPRLSTLENLYESSQKERERMKDNLSYINYDRGKISVYNKDGKIEYIDANDFDPSKHYRASMADEYNYKVNSLGFAADPTPFQANMSKFEDVVKRVDDFLGKTGSTQYEQAKGFKDENEKQYFLSAGRDNIAQLNAKVDMIMSGAGLSQADVNTIMSQYYDSKISSGEKPSKQEANYFFVKFVDDIKKGHVDQRAKISEQEYNQQTGNKGAQSIGNEIFTGVYGKGLTFSFDPQGKVSEKQGSVEYNAVPELALVSKSKYTTTDYAGNTSTYDKKNASDLVILDAADKSNPVIMDLNSKSASKGSLVIPTGFADLNSRIQVTNMGQVSIPYRMVNGKKQYDMAMENPEGYEQMFLVNGKIGALEKKGFYDSYFGENADMDNKIIQFAEKYGLDYTEYDELTQEVKDYTFNTNIEQFDFESGWTEGNDSFRMYNISYLVPIKGINNDEKARNIDAYLKYQGNLPLTAPTVPGGVTKRGSSLQGQENNYVDITALQQ